LSAHDRKCAIAKRWPGKPSLEEPNNHRHNNSETELQRRHLAHFFSEVLSLRESTQSLLPLVTRHENSDEQAAARRKEERQPCDCRESEEDNQR
jgi:hypothetical protein